MIKICWIGENVLIYWFFPLKFHTVVLLLFWIFNPVSPVYRNYLHFVGWWLVFSLGVLLSHSFSLIFVDFWVIHLEVYALIHRLKYRKTAYLLRLGSQIFCNSLKQILLVYITDSGSHISVRRANYLSGLKVF